MTLNEFINKKYISHFINISKEFFINRLNSFIVLFLYVLSISFTNCDISKYLIDTNKIMATALTNDDRKETIIYPKNQNYTLKWGYLSPIQKFSNKQLKAITDYLDGHSIIKYYFQLEYSYNKEDAALLDYWENSPFYKDEVNYNNCAAAGSQFSIFETEKDDKYMNLYPDRRLSKNIDNHLPETEEEIALTSYKADYYLNYGYRQEAGGSIQEISSLNELIGKTLSGRTICGIFETPEYKEYVDKNIPIRMDKAPSFYDNSAFLLKGSLENFLQKTFSAEAPDNYGIYIKIKNNYSENLNLLNKIRFYSSTFDGPANTGDYFKHFRMNVNFSHTKLNTIDSAIDTFTSNVYYIIAAVIITFSIIFITIVLLKLIRIIIKVNKKSKIVTLKSSLIYNLIIFPIMIILYLLSLPLTWILVIISNVLLGYPILYINWIIFGYCLLFTICISTLLYLIMFIIQLKKAKETDNAFKTN